MDDNTKPDSQLTRMADGVTPLHVGGEVHFQLTSGAHVAPDQFPSSDVCLGGCRYDVLAGNHGVGRQF